MSLRLNSAYRHKRTGRVYIAVHVVPATMDDGKRLDFVAYRRPEDGAVFACVVQHFEQHFELVKETP